MRPSLAASDAHADHTSSLACHANADRAIEAVVAAAALTAAAVGLHTWDCTRGIAHVDLRRAAWWSGVVSGVVERRGERRGEAATCQIESW